MIIRAQGPKFFQYYVIIIAALFIFIADLHKVREFCQ